MEDDKSERTPFKSCDSSFHVGEIGWYMWPYCLRKMASEEALHNIYTRFVDQNYGESGENVWKVL